MRQVCCLLVFFVLVPPYALGIDVEVKATAASEDIAVGSPIAVRVFAKNVDFEKIVLPTPLNPAAGTVLFQIRGPDKTEYRVVPGSLVFELSIGPRTEWKRFDLHEAAALLIPSTDDPYFDRTGLWSLRIIVASGDVRGTSEPIKIFVRAATKEELRQSLQLNKKLIEAISAGRKTAPKFYERIIESSATGRELQKVATWNLAIARLMESDSIEREYKSAVELQSTLDDCNKVLFTAALAETLFDLKKDEFARKQLVKLDSDSQKRIEYAVQEKRRNDAERVENRPLK